MRNITHGTATGYVYGCRCDACRAANAARMREYRMRRMDASPSGRFVTTRGTTEKCPRDVGASGGVAHKETPS